MLENGLAGGARAALLAVRDVIEIVEQGDVEPGGNLMPDARRKKWARPKGTRTSNPRKGADAVKAGQAYRPGGEPRANSGNGKPGRPSPLDDPHVWDTVMTMAAVRMAPSEICGAIRVHPGAITEWLNKAERLMEDGVQAEDSRWVRFYYEYHASRSQGVYTALSVMLQSKDPRYVERWLTRTDDELNYVDKDKLVSRPEINIGVLNGAGGTAAGVDLGRSLSLGRQSAQERLGMQMERRLREGVVETVGGEVVEVEDEKG